MTLTLTASTYVRAPYEAVWHAFAHADGYAAWASAPCLEFGRRPGDPVVWGSRDRVVYRGEIERIEHGRGLAHTFRFVGFGFEEPPSRVEIDILAQGEVIHVAVRHDCAGAPRTREIIGPLGWVKALARLKTLLETGRAMPWPSDTGPGDTGPGDTGPGDTEPSDTGPGDTGPGDTGGAA